MSMSIANPELARDRIRKILTFLKAYQSLKTPPKRCIEEYEWHLSIDSLPKHPCVFVGYRTASQLAAGGTDVVLRVRRPPLTPCPSPPNSLAEWINPGWQKFGEPPTFQETRNIQVAESSRVIRFGDSQQRIDDRRQWLAARAAWEVAERLPRSVESFYQKIYALYGRIQRESENVQLLIGDGIAHALDTQGRVEHPVLVQRVELRFNPQVPEFEIVETDDPPELAMSVLSAIVGDDGQILADSRQLSVCQDELRQDPQIHPLDDLSTTGFLTRIVQGAFAQGSFCHAKPAHIGAGQVALWRAPVLYLAPRVGSFASALDASLRRLDSMAAALIPRALAALVNVDLTQPPMRNDEGIPSGASVSTEPEILLTRHANPEQTQVIRQLDQRGMVLVQGPPGTGKTHTIANLVGHALAHGKTVLITSKSTKALRVVRRGGWGRPLWAAPSPARGAGTALKSSHVRLQL